MALRITRKTGEVVCIGDDASRITVKQTGERTSEGRPTVTLTIMGTDYTHSPGDTLRLSVQTCNGAEEMKVKVDRCSPSRTVLLFDGPRSIEVWRAEILTRRMTAPKPLTQQAMAAARQAVAS